MPAGQDNAMLWLLVGVMTLLYILFWPFSLRLDARLSPASGRAEVTVATLLRLRLEGDFMQPPWLTLYRLDGQGRRRPLSGRRNGRSGFAPVIWDKRLMVTLCVGAETDGALTVEALGLLYALLEAVGRGYGVDLALRPTPASTKTSAH